MPPSARNYIDRNDLARLLEMTVDQVTLNETRWGIDQFKIRFNDRTIRFDRIQTLQQLEKLGFLTRRMVEEFVKK